MQTKNRLSYSQIRTYNTCGRKYELYYRKKLRSIYKSSALIYGSALDSALNELFKDRSIDPAPYFEKAFTFAEVNKRGTLEYIPTHTSLVYAERDFDLELLTEDCKTAIQKKAEELGIDFLEIGMYIEDYLVQKKARGLSNMEVEKIQLYNFIVWKALYQKGLVTLKSYTKKVLPLVKSTIAVQEAIEAENSHGDTIVGFADVLLEMHDGSRVLFDNKTSSLQYHGDSARFSPQLTLYFNILKEKYNLTHVGYIVMSKNLRKNKKKKCAYCGHNGTGSRAKTCDNVVNKVRCNANWIEKNNFECDITILTDQVSELTQNLVIETFDLANESIKKGDFAPNLEVCNPLYGLPCEYLLYCHKGIKKDLEEQS